MEKRRVLLHLLLLTLFSTMLASPARAATFGDVTVTERPSLPAPTYNAYYEYRFELANNGPKQHVVTLTALTIQPYGSTRWQVSRSFVLAPRSRGVGTIPQLIRAGSTAQTLLVTVDGTPQRQAVPLNSPSVGDQSFTAVLVGDTVSTDRLNAELQATSTANFGYVRAGTGAVDWSTSWLQYSRFGGVLLTVRDWELLAPPVREALLRWSYAGGVLAFAGPAPALPVVPPDRGKSRINFAPNGLGGIVLLPEFDTTFDFNDMRGLRSFWQRHIISSLETRSAVETLPLLPNQPLPATSMFSIMLVFAIVAGPVNLFVLARRNKRIWLFWTVPLLAIVASVIIVASLLINEGWVRVQRSRTLTLLDENRGEAATFGWTGVYSTAAPERIRFANTTQVQVPDETETSEANWSEGQDLVSWVRSRVPTYFVVRKSEARRERLTIRTEGSNLTVVNGLGAPITRLLVATDDGTVYQTGKVPAGARAPLERTVLRTDTRAVAPDGFMQRPETWPGTIERFSQNPRSALHPGMYVAVLDGSPFLETVVERPTKLMAETVVVGVTKRSADAR
ncbi:MAG TPA: hypothetical protein VGF69_25130 [Thermoanaerobaculia bacterium]|jgi:hypothetical protein